MTNHNTYRYHAFKNKFLHDLNEIMKKHMSTSLTKVL